MPGGNPYPLPYLARRFRESKPGNVSLIIIHSRLCPRACDFCYIEKMDWKNTPFDDALIDKAIETEPNPRLGFAGGEPFADPEAVDTFLRAAHKWHNCLGAIKILSNMDNWAAYEDRIRAIPAPVTIITNSRQGKTYRSSGNVRIWNKIFVDEVKEFTYETGPDCFYLFELKKPTAHNDMDNFGDFDYFEVEARAKELWDAGCCVALMSISDFTDFEGRRKALFDHGLRYIRKTVFPVGWKDEIEHLSAICKKCGLEDEDCVAAIEANKCPRHHWECVHCPKINECCVTNIDEKIVDKWRIPDCSKQIALFDLAREYRAKRHARADANHTHAWDISDD